MTTNELDLTADIIDIRDIIERMEKLEPLLGEMTQEQANEHTALSSILEDLKGNGGDEQWRGDWYPITLIRGSYFQDYAIELLEDCGDIPKNLPSYIEIDWHQTAMNIRMDYTPVDIDGVTYWYR